MQLPPFAVVIIILLFGFLSGSTAFFYTKSRTVATAKNKNVTSFNGDITTDKTNEPSKIDQLTKPAEPKGRLSYPANSYVVAPGETLFAIGTKMGLDWQLIMKANGITNENVVQAGYSLAIPKISDVTGYYRVNFIINDEKATTLNAELRKESSSEYFNPIEVAKKSAVPYFGAKADDTFRLVEQDTSKNTAVVEIKKVDYSIIVGLAQPKVTGEKGLWAVVYSEKQDQ